MIENHKCTISVYLAYAMISYIFASVYYLAMTRGIGTPFNNSLTEDQKKIKKQGMVTNARDEEHLKNLIKVYKQMGGKGIKESLNEAKGDPEVIKQLRDIVKKKQNKV